MDERGDMKGGLKADPEDVRQPQRPSTRRRLAQLNRDWFCLPVACGAFLALTLVAVPLIVWVLVPAIAQGMMDGARFEYARCNIANASDTQFDLELVGRVLDAGPFFAEVSFEEPVALLWRGQELGRLAMPALQIRPGGAEVSMSTRVSVSNVDALTASIRHIVASEFFVWEIRGRISARALGFQLGGLYLRKLIKLRGINGMQDIEVQRFTLPGDEPGGLGVHLDIAARVQNPSPASLRLGNVVFSVCVQNATIGQVTIPDMEIRPGWNELEMTGYLQKLRSRNDAALVSRFFSQYMAGEKTAIHVVGLRVESDPPVRWLNDAIRGLEIDTSVQSATELQFLKSVQLGTVGLSISDENPSNPTLWAPQVAAEFQMPFGDFPLSVRAVRLDLELMSTVPGSNATVGRIRSPWTAAAGTLQEGAVKTSLDRVPLAIGRGSEVEFARFCREIATTAGVVRVPFRGTADVVARASIGEFVVEGVRFQDAIPFRGLNGLQDAAIKLQTLRLSSATPHAILVEATIAMQFESNIEFQLHGGLRTELYYRGVYVGYARPRAIALKPGRNVMDCVAVFEPADRTSGSPAALMAQAFAEGDRAIAVEVRGGARASTVKVLNEAIGALALQTAVPGLDRSLLEGAWFQISVADALRYRTATAVFAVYNSFDLPITITKLYVDFFYEGAALGYVDEQFSAAGAIQLPAHVVTHSPSVTAHFNIQLKGLKAILSALTSSGRGFLVRAECKLHVLVGSFPLELAYNQDGIFVQLGAAPSQG